MHPGFFSWLQEGSDPYLPLLQVLRIFLQMQRIFSGSPLVPVPVLAGSPDRPEPGYLFYTPHLF